MSKKVKPPEGADDLSAGAVKEQRLDSTKYKKDGHLRSAFYDEEIARLDAASG